MPQAQLNALIAVAHQLPAVAEEMRRANRLKALELKIRLRNDWGKTDPDVLASLDEIAEIMGRDRNPAA